MEIVLNHDKTSVKLKVLHQCKLLGIHFSNLTLVLDFVNDRMNFTIIKILKNT